MTDEECGCCNEDKDECCEDLPVEEVAHMAHDKVDALIGLLIKKDIIKEEELQKEYDDMFENDES